MFGADAVRCMRRSSGGGGGSGEYRYWRLRWIESSGITAYPCGIAELEFRSDGIKATPKITDENDTRLFASSYLPTNFTYGPRRAFDEALSSEFVCAAGDTYATLGFDFEAPQAINGVGLGCRAHSNSYQRMPISFAIEGSNDFSNWELVFEIYDEPVWTASGWRDYSFED